MSFDSAQMATDGRPPTPRKLLRARKAFTPSEQVAADQLTKTAEAMINQTELQEDLQELVNRPCRAGWEITAEETSALMEHLRPQGVILSGCLPSVPSGKWSCAGWGGAGHDRHFPPQAHRHDPGARPMVPLST